jgi:hypothetical protein
MTAAATPAADRPVAPVPAGPVLAFIGRRRRRRRPHRRADQLTTAYIVALYAAFGGWWAAESLRTAQTTPAEAGAAVAALTRWGPALLALALAAAARFATWHGPVAFTPPDVHWLLGAPLSHAALVRRQLLRAAVLAAGLGAASGLCLYVVLQAELGVAAGPLLATAVGGMAALGALAVGLGWLVESSVAWSRAVLRLGPLVIVACAALVLAGSGGWPARAAFWSGPWGWAVGPVVAAAGGQVPGWQAQAALLALATLAIVWSAWSRAGRAPTEELARRAGLHSSLVAGVYTLDLRGVTLARRQGIRALLGVRRLRVHRPRSRRLAVPWRDATSLVRAPARAGWAAALGAGGVLAPAQAPGRPAVTVAAVLAGYLAAARLVEPVRVEADQPDAHLALAWRWGHLLLLHCALPLLVLTVTAWLSVAAAWLAGLLPAAGAVPALAGCPLAAAVLVLAAATAGQRGRFPLELLFLAGELGGLLLLVWVATGPLLAVTILIGPATALRLAAEEGVPLGVAAAGAALGLLLVLLAQVAFLRGRRPPGSG